MEPRQAYCAGLSVSVSLVCMTHVSFFFSHGATKKNWKCNGFSLVQCDIVGCGGIGCQYGADLFCSQSF